MNTTLGNHAGATGVTLLETPVFSPLRQILWASRHAVVFLSLARNRVRTLSQLHDNVAPLAIIRKYTMKSPTFAFPGIPYVASHAQATKTHHKFHTNFSCAGHAGECL